MVSSLMSPPPLPIQLPSPAIPFGVPSTMDMHPQQLAAKSQQVMTIMRQTSSTLFAYLIRKQ